MNLYYLNRTKLVYKRVNGYYIIIGILISYILLYVVLPTKIIESITHHKTPAIIVDDNNTFSKDLLIEMLFESNVKYPMVVYAQAVLESSNFTSESFRSYNNLFGLKKARQRPTMAKTTIGLGHGYFETWRECVADYCILQTFHREKLKTITSDNEYLRHLIDIGYAEDTVYINKLTDIIKTNSEIKEHFEEELEEFNLKTNKK